MSFIPFRPCFCSIHHPSLIIELERGEYKTIRLGICFLLNPHVANLILAWSHVFVGWVVKKPFVFFHLSLIYFPVQKKIIGVKYFLISLSWLYSPIIGFQVHLWCTDMSMCEWPKKSLSRLIFFFRNNLIWSAILKY